MKTTYHPRLSMPFVNTSRTADPAGEMRLSKLRAFAEKAASSAFGLCETGGYADPWRCCRMESSAIVQRPCPHCGALLSIAEMDAHVCPTPEHERKPGETPTSADMPDWWPENVRPMVLEAGRAYKDRNGKWRDHTGRLIPRRERRANKLR